MSSGGPSVIQCIWGNRPHGSKLVGYIILAWIWPVVGIAQSTDTSNLGDLSFAELANITVTTAGRHEEKLFLTTAAVAVISSGEVARFGNSQLTDVLRLSPGVHVAQISPAAWAVAIRGFNSQDSRKLLVMRDGRSVYDTLFSGVWWDVQDPVLDDINRIEIVRGPGGAVWGANAVNGVINVITKTAQETQGSRVMAQIQDDGSWLGAVRHGWAMGAETYARFSLQERVVEDADMLTGTEGRNGMRLTTGTLRVDQGDPGLNGFTLHGNFHTGSIRQNLHLPVLAAPYQRQFTEDVQVDGASLHGRLDRTSPGLGQLTFQAYVDYFERDRVSLDERNLTLDFDFQHNLPVAGRHQVIWGAGGRLIEDELGSGSGTLAFVPASRSRLLFSAFAEDDFELVPMKLSLVVGGKVEHSDYSGWEFQPNVRLRWTPKDNQTYWAAVSRAVRTPDRTSDFWLRLATIPPAASPGALPTEVIFQGNPDVKSEQLLAFETGARWLSPGGGWRLEAALFANQYNRLVNFTSGGLSLGENPARVISRVSAANEAQGQTYGGEVSLLWELRKGWRLSADWSVLSADLDGSGLPFVDNSEGQNPEHMVSLRTSHDFNSAWRLDLVGRYVGQLTEGRVPAYLEADFQLTWRSSASLDVSLLGRNLLSPDHFESPSARIGTPSALVARSFALQINASF